MLLALVGVHVTLTIATALLAPRLGPKTFLIAALGPLAGVALLIASARDVLTGHPWQNTTIWVPGLRLDLTLRLDGFSWLMLILVCGVGLMIFLFTAWYAHRDETLTRFVATLTAFAGAMVGLVLADNLLLLYTFWELTSVTSFLLVGLKTDDPASRRAALQALLITMLGGLAMLVGMLIVADAAGTMSLSAILADFPAPTGAVSTGVALLLLGALTKSAQAPFHIWLPGAMAAPTPVSAYLHAAAMVKAGIYLIGRLAPAVADQIDWWRPTLVAFGLATMLVGGWRALRQHDLKRLLAFSTVSQLGFLTVVAGWGTHAAQVALALLLLTHGFAKAALFCSLGAVDHQAHTRDLRLLSGVARSMPVLAAAAWVAALSMGGVPLFLGFIAKEEVLGLLATGAALDTVTLAGVLLGSVLTLAYGLRYAWGAFGTKALRDGDPDLPEHPTQIVDGAALPPPAAGMVVPIVALSAVSLGLGVAPGLLDSVVGAAANRPPTLGPTGQDVGHTRHDVHLALWHGLNLPLLLSAGVIVLGVTLFALRPQVLRGQDRLAPVARPFDVDTGYGRGLRALDRLAAAVTGRTQVGSLPVYLGTIVVVAVALPGSALVLGESPWRTPPLVDVPAQVPVAFAIAGAALMACLVRVRLTAVLLLGAAGYGVACMFALQGAPDLALTQLLVETLSLVVFLFVLRLLPHKFPQIVRRSANRTKAVIAVAVGVLATGLALFATTPNRTNEVDPSVAEAMLADSYPKAHGRNVVNVILVDFRGLDTLGEATVVLVAALGIAALVLTARDRAANGELPRRPPSLLLRVAVRVAFHPILATALYLLFAGHNNPGGGFIAGLVAGSGFVLRYLAADVDRASTPLNPRILLWLGLLLAAGTGFVPLLFGHDLLTSGYASVDLPVLGSVSFASVLIFDTGVFCIVVGITLLILDTLGSRRSTSLGVVNEDVTL